MRDRISKLLLEARVNFSENIKFTDWSEFKDKLDAAIQRGFDSDEELITLMGMNPKTYEKIVDSMIFNWKDSVSKSLLHSIEELDGIPQQGTGIFRDLKQQTLFLIIASRGIQTQDVFGSTNGVSGLNMINYFIDLKPIKDKRIDGFPALAVNDERATNQVSKIIQYVWLYAFYQDYKLKKEKIKLPKVLYRGIRFSNIFNFDNIKELIAHVWKSDKTHEMKKKEVVDIIISYIVEHGLNSVMSGRLLSFTSSSSIASYFANGEGFVVSVDPQKVKIITSEKTEPRLAEKDYVSNKSEKEYIIRIPDDYQFKKQDIKIEDLDYFVADQNPLCVAFFDHNDKQATYDIGEYNVQARFIWFSNESGGIRFGVSKGNEKLEYSETRKTIKQQYGFDPMPTENNLDQITNFKIENVRNW